MQLCLKKRAILQEVHIFVVILLRDSAFVPSIRPTTVEKREYVSIIFKGAC
jgi:hypothetical protein